MELIAHSLTQTLIFVIHIPISLTKEIVHSNNSFLLQQSSHFLFTISICSTIFNYSHPNNSSTMFNFLRQSSSLPNSLNKSLYISQSHNLFYSHNSLNSLSTLLPLHQLSHTYSLTPTYSISLTFQSLLLALSTVNNSASLLHSNNQNR